MLLSTAFLQPSTYVTEPEGYEFGLKLATTLRWNCTAFTSVIESYLGRYDDTRTRPLYINVPNVNCLVGNYTYPPVEPLASLRTVEKEIIVYEDFEEN